MSASIVVCQPLHKVAHVVTDAASYSSDGVVKSFGTKCMPISHWPGAITTRGPALALSLLGVALSREFASFDDAVEGMESKLPRLVDVYGHGLIDNETVEITLAGWSHERSAPESYVIYTDRKPPPGESQANVDANAYMGDAYKLIRLPNAITGPAVIDADLVIAADYEGIDIDAAPDVVRWTMAKVLEMQRRTLFPSGHYCIGGWGAYTMIQPDGVAQFVMQRWTEDRVGEMIQPGSMDWHRLNATKPNALLAARRQGIKRVV